MNNGISGIRAGSPGCSSACPSPNPISSNSLSSRISPSPSSHDQVGDIVHDQVGDIVHDQVVGIVHN